MKIEAKGSLFKIKCSDGCYSDYSEETFVVSANTAEEAKHVFKMALTEKLITYGYDMCGAVFEDGEQFKIKEPPAYREGSINWSTNYGDVFSVKINRLEVIYP